MQVGIRSAKRERGSRTTVDRPIAVVDAVNTASPVTLYVHADHLHRPVRMTNAAKATQWDVIWTPWGAPHTITGAQTLNARAFCLPASGRTASGSSTARMLVGIRSAVQRAACIVSAASPPR
jgi:hypothetical protein